MALICIGSVCFSLFHIGIIILFIINYFSSHLKKLFYHFFPNNNELDSEIKSILQLKKKNKEYEESRYIELQKNECLKEIFSSTKNLSVVLKFSSMWCKPCNNVKEYFKSQTDFFDVTLVSIDVDIHKKLMESHKIRALPTFEFYFLLKNEWIITCRIEGGNKNEIEKAFQKYCLPKE
ncbi:thioredoxin 3, putative [Plasmodium gallinaceum]|uniref:Thioredoxin 3, putative n=1 Tax=Plasmodium gallinaceum TaxID=5849 RepID=A0A1J1GW66_PLAGA|nr:thioredoxin 3, putative [Plasmodium gallinaceum]CRG96710.1 thioredoxin 3, putative [Plasmodium gallinaceum]